jgi:hypothetical protein
MRWKAQAQQLVAQEQEHRAAHAGLLQLLLHVKIVADRRPTTQDGIKTRATGGRSVGGRSAEALHIASFRGLRRSAGQCHSSRLQASCS